MYNKKCCTIPKTHTINLCCLQLHRYHIAGYLHGKLFLRTCQNSLETEMLTEEIFAKCAMALIMIMFVCVYNISLICTRASFSISSMVRGYHKYKDIWVFTEGEQLLCRREKDNIHNLFSVAVIMATSDGRIIVKRSSFG